MQSVNIEDKKEKEGEERLELILSCDHVDLRWRCQTLSDSLVLLLSSTTSARVETLWTDSGVTTLIIWFHQQLSTSVAGLRVVGTNEDWNVLLRGYTFIHKVLAWHKREMVCFNSSPPSNFTANIFVCEPHFKSLLFQSVVLYCGGTKDHNAERRQKVMMARKKYILSAQEPAQQN